MVHTPLPVLEKKVPAIPNVYILLVPQRNGSRGVDQGVCKDLLTTTPQMVHVRGSIFTSHWRPVLIPKIWTSVN